MLIDQRENFIVRIDINRSAMKRFYQLLRALDFYGQITWEFRLGSRSPQLVWQGLIFEQDSAIATLAQHLPAFQSFATRLSIIPLLRILIRPKVIRCKENLSFSSRQG